jgi:hypothetical protein
MIKNKANNQTNMNSAKDYWTEEDYDNFEEE